MRRWARVDEMRPYEGLCRRVRYAGGCGLGKWKKRQTANGRRRNKSRNKNGWISSNASLAVRGMNVVGGGYGVRGGE